MKIILAEKLNCEFHGVYIALEHGDILCRNTVNGENFICGRADNVEELTKVICAAGDYAVKKEADIAVDASGFVAAGYSFSYIYGLFTSMEADIDVTIYGISGNSEYISLGESFFFKPNEQIQKLSFGERGDPLKDRFEDFQASITTVPFYEYLRRLIDSKGFVSQAQVCLATGISKFTLSKLLNYKIRHKPSKETLAALAIGLRLSLSEAEELYNQCGYHLNEVDFLDRVIIFYISQGIYKIDEVNYCLYYYGFPVLGEKTRGENY